MIIYQVSGLRLGPCRLPLHPALQLWPLIALQDLVSGDEIISDVYKVIDAGSGLLEVDGKMVKPGSENFGWFKPIHCEVQELT